jgi:peptide/nickel transport system substrate-binding protein
VPAATTAMTEPLGGPTDWSWDYAGDEDDNISRMPNLQTLQLATMRVHSMSIDAAGRSGAGNPFTKIKAR